MFLLFVFAFLAGLVTIFAPCIWPLLPIILSSSVNANDHRKPLGVTIGIMISFTFFTLVLSTLVRIFHIDPNIFRVIAATILIVLGLTLIIPAMSRVLEGLVSRLSGSFGTQQKRSGFWGGLLTGLSLGILWTPCAGPILAAVAVIAATGTVTLNVFLVTLFYVIGVGIPLFILAYAGQKIFAGSTLLSKYTGRIQQVFGVVMILTALAIYTNYDIVLQAQLLKAFPQFTGAFSSVENNATVEQQLQQLKNTKQTTVSSSSSNLSDLGSAPEFNGITKWLNISGGRTSLTMQQLRGKVVLIDFWTYTCINCIRTLPYVTNWYDKYKDDGFVVIGVHTPEFEVEKNTDNVLSAIKTFNIHYPVAQDNNYGTWNAYNNQYWPAEYLIDSKGIIRHEHFGEGEYDQTEKDIQELLRERMQTERIKGTISSTFVNAGSFNGTNLDQIASPETYFGSARNQYLGNGIQGQTGIQSLSLPQAFTTNTLYLGGEWNFQDQFVTNTKANATIVYQYNAKNVYLVASADHPVTLQITLDGKSLGAAAGTDVVTQNGNSFVTVHDARLYNLISDPNGYGQHTVQITVLSPGFHAFTFTFG